LAVTFSSIRKQRAYEQVLEQIVGLISAGELRPGDRLPPERVLSEMLGISRPSLREALRVLDAMGIIDARTGNGAGAGTVISDEPGDSLFTLMRLHLALSHFPVEDFLEVRRILETWTVRRAAAVRTDADIAALKSLVAAMDKSVSDREAFFALDAEFHILIARIAGNNLVSYLMQAIRDAMTQEMNKLSDAWGNWEDLGAIAMSDHKRIVNSIAKGNTDAAERALADHLSTYGGRRQRPNGTG
jgi:DNA-binding FadR family transcriptional regulator